MFALLPKISLNELRLAGDTARIQPSKIFPRPWQLVAVPKLKVLCRGLCCRDIDPNRQNTEHSLEEQFWNFATILRPFHTMAAGSCPKVAILAQTLLAPNDQNSIEEQVLNLATAPVIAAPVRLAGLLWWLPRRAKQSLYGD